MGLPVCVEWQTDSAVDRPLTLYRIYQNMEFFSEIVCGPSERNSVQMWNQGKWTSAFSNYSYEVVTGKGEWKI